MDLESTKTEVTKGENIEEPSRKIRKTKAEKELDRLERLYEQQQLLQIQREIDGNNDEYEDLPLPPEKEANQPAIDETIKSLQKTPKRTRSTLKLKNSQKKETESQNVNKDNDKEAQNEVQVEIVPIVVEDETKKQRKPRSTLKNKFTATPKKVMVNNDVNKEEISGIHDMVVDSITPLDNNKRPLPPGRIIQMESEDNEIAKQEPVNQTNNENENDKTFETKPSTSDDTTKTATPKKHQRSTKSKIVPKKDVEGLDATKNSSDRKLANQATMLKYFTLAPKAFISPTENLEPLAERSKRLGNFKPFLAPQGTSVVPPDLARSVSSVVDDMNTNTVQEWLQNCKIQTDVVQRWKHIPKVPSVEIPAVPSELPPDFDTTYKLISFHYSVRPTYFGTFQRHSEIVNGRWIGKNVPTDGRLVDYEKDSEDEWEEPGEGDDIVDDEDNDEVVDDEDDEMEDYVVDDDYLSADEGLFRSDEEDEGGKENIENLQLKRKRRQKVSTVANVIGLCWSSLDCVHPLSRYKIVSLSEDRIFPSLETLISTVQLVREDKITERGVPKKIVPEKHMPDLIRIMHGCLSLHVGINSFMELHGEECSKIQTESRIREICSREKSEKRKRWKVKPEILALYGLENAFPNLFEEKPQSDDLTATTKEIKIKKNREKRTLPRSLNEAANYRPKKSIKVFRMDPNTNSNLSEKDLLIQRSSSFNLKPDIKITTTDDITTTTTNLPNEHPTSNLQNEPPTSNLLNEQLTSDFNKVKKPTDHLKKEQETPPDKGLNVLIPRSRNKVNVTKD